MVALFYYLAVRKHDYLIRVLNCGKTVSDNKHCADRLYLLKRILNEKLGLRVDIGGCLVKYNDGGLVNYRSRKGKKLSLSCGEVVAPLSDLFVKAARKLVYKVACVDVVAGFQHLLIGDGVISQNDVGANRTRKEEYILKHLSEVAAQGRKLDFLYINSVNENLALLYVVVTADKRKNGGLS